MCEIICSELLCLGYLFEFSVLFFNILQEKGSNEIVFKAMGRAINKTVTIVELIKVIQSLIHH